MAKHTIRQRQFYLSLKQRRMVFPTVILLHRYQQKWGQQQRYNNYELT
ncbi:MAG: hypothetical protein ACTHMD_04270 [Flavisolibacter sp.]